MQRRTLLIIIAATATLGFAVPQAPAAGLAPYQEKTFAEAMAAGPVVVHVHADWCPVCKAQQPTLEKLSKEPALAKVKFVSVNFDKDKGFLRANRIANQSVIVIFKGGKEVGRLSGTTDAAKIREGVSRAL